ncbi:MAG: 5'-3' exonuclease H3TH domain-containing protein, partial [Phycisphaerales bacterium]|nr:5'-3' exonuclease H3TH domain-containing protein [Phycisphaerales bacterium]
MDRLWIVDGHAAFFRAYHAIRGGMTSPVTGEPTHLVYGFTGTLLNMIRTHQPTKLVVVIDAAGDTETFRTKLYADYKANRDEAPEDFGPQVERCLELLRLMRIPVFGLEGVEADDTIASIITQCAAKHSDLAIRIASRDKDLTQLCSPRVDMFDAMKDALVTPSDVFKTEGVEPHMVGDILALMGDTADNIPGVPGIGPKTAAKLIIEHGDLEGLYEALPGLKGKKMQAIGEHRETTALARQLVELKRDLDTGFDLDDADFDGGQIDLEGLDGLCRQLGFNTYPRSFRELAGAEASAPEAPATEAVPTSRKSSAAPDPIDGGLFGAAETEAEPTTPKASLGNYRCLCTAEEVQAYAQELLGVDRFAFDTETTSLRARPAALVGLSFSTKAGEAVYIPVDSPDPSQHLGLSEVLDMLQPVLAHEGIRKVAHNLKYDLQILRGAGFEVVGPFGDTMISSYLLDSTRSSHGLDALSLGLLGMEMT